MMRHGWDVEIRTLRSEDPDFSEESRLQTNPRILWQNTGDYMYTFAHVFSEITHTGIHLYSFPTLGDLLSIVRA